MRLGTHYGGWAIPQLLTSNSFVVSIGAGEDISFDLAVQSLTGCKVLILDPTERAIKHFTEVQQFYSHKKQITGNIQTDYIPLLRIYRPTLSKIQFLPYGVWSSDTVLKFYKQSNPSYVSQTLIPNLYTDSFTTVPVKRLSTLLQQNNLPKPDCIKMDIEGAELEVIETLFEDDLLPKILCVEFDLYLKGGDPTQKTLKIIQRLIESGYTIYENQSWNITFVK
jgi:FkbM family methyltransferase